MPDSTTDAINRIYDLVDSGVEKIDLVINRGKNVSEQHRARRGNARPAVIDAEPARQPESKPSKQTAVAAKARYYIVEVVDPRTSKTIYAVTDGGNARAECATREMAAQILKALESAP